MSSATQPEAAGSAWLVRQRAIRQTAIHLLIGALLCLYFGFQLPVDAPLAASPAEQEMWYGLDAASQWALRVLGVLFALAAVLAWAGWPVSQLLATLAEVAFVALMLAMAALWTIEARISGGWNASVLILIILGVLGVSSARDSWRLYCAARHRNADAT